MDSEAERKAMAARLVQAREMAGLDGPVEAHRALRMPYQTYAAHENGSRGFRQSAARYARFYKVRLEWLLTGEGDMTAHPAIHIYDDLPADKRREWIEYGNYLKNKN